MRHSMLVYCFEENYFKEDIEKSPITDFSSDLQFYFLHFILFFAVHRKTIEIKWTTFDNQ